MRVFLKHWRSGSEMAREIAKIGAAALLYPAIVILAAPLVRRQADALCKLCRAAGKTAALLGHRYDEYATIHGN